MNQMCIRDSIYDLYKGDHDAIAAYIGGATYKDEQIAETMKQCYNCLLYTSYRVVSHSVAKNDNMFHLFFYC